MATVSILDRTEMILLPFCTLIPMAGGILGYIGWKRGLIVVGNMNLPLMASSAIMTGMALFHVLLTIAVSGGAGGTYDPRFGLSAMGTTFCLCVALKVRKSFCV